MATELVQKNSKKAHQKYNTYDRELLFIYMALKYFRRMFDRQYLIIYTDHTPLTEVPTANSKNETPKRTRYLKFISHFTANIQHIAGEANHVADALFRVKAITFPTPYDYEVLAKIQEQVELKSLPLNKQP